MLKIDRESKIKQNYKAIDNLNIMGMKGNFLRKKGNKYNKVEL